MKSLSEVELRKLYEARAKIVDIAEHFNVCVPTIYRNIKALGLTRKPLTVRQDVTNNVYNSLVALKFVKVDNHAKAIWLFRCNCGKEFECGIASVKRGLTKSCGCYKRSKLRKGIGDLSWAYWHKLAKSAAQRNFVFDITIQQGWELFLQQQRQCALSGLPLLLSPNNDRYRIQTASLDRIDSTLGYILDNVQWVHKRVQFLKRDYSEEELIFWCTKIANKQHTRYIDITERVPKEMRFAHNTDIQIARILHTV